MKLQTKLLCDVCDKMLLFQQLFVGNSLKLVSVTKWEQKVFILYIKNSQGNADNLK